MRGHRQRDTAWGITYLCDEAADHENGEGQAADAESEEHADDPDEDRVDGAGKAVDVDGGGVERIALGEAHEGPADGARGLRRR